MGGGKSQPFRPLPPGPSALPDMMSAEFAVEQARPTSPDLNVAQPSPLESAVHFGEACATGGEALHEVR